MAVTLRHGAILHSTLPLSSPPVTNGLNEHLCETIIPGTGALAPIVDDAFAAFLSPSPVRSFPPEKKIRSPALMVACKKTILTSCLGRPHPGVKQMSSSDPWEAQAGSFCPAYRSLAVLYQQGRPVSSMTPVK